MNLSETLGNEVFVWQHVRRRCGGGYDERPFQDREYVLMRSLVATCRPALGHDVEHRFAAVFIGSQCDGHDLLNVNVSGVIAACVARALGDRPRTGVQFGQQVPRATRSAARARASVGD